MYSLQVLPLSEVKIKLTKRSCTGENESAPFQYLMDCDMIEGRLESATSVIAWCGSPYQEATTYLDFRFRLFFHSVYKAARYHALWTCYKKSFLFV